MKQKKFYLIAMALLSLVFTSCSDRVIGYSIVLWNIPEHNIQSGDVLPVYVKSNISKVYVAGDVDGNKIEVPLWKLTEPVGKLKLGKLKKLYSEHYHTYAFVKNDGLPCRAETSNISKQVYRFRKNEQVKILYKGEGEAPKSGKTPLPGEWYRVLTSDGTEGWCFSYSLNIYELDANGKPIGGEELVLEDEEDPFFKTILDNTWYPETFRTMIDNEDIDLSKFNASYKFQIDQEKNKVILNTDEIHESWDYKGYKQISDKEYRLNDIPIRIGYRKEDYIVVRYTDESGKPVSIIYVTIDGDVEEMVKAEKEKRTAAYDSILAQGPSFSSSTYGSLSFTKDGTFKWTGFDLLEPSIIPLDAKHAGTVSIKYSVSDEVKRSYSGVLTFTFQGDDEVNFFYKVESGGLRLEDTSTAIKDENQYKERGSSPVIIYFKSK